jgi:hypothetical protein
LFRLAILLSARLVAVALVPAEEKERKEPVILDLFERNGSLVSLNDSIESLFDPLPIFSVTSVLSVIPLVAEVTLPIECRWLSLMTADGKEESTVLTVDCRCGSESVRSTDSCDDLLSFFNDDVRCASRPDMPPET